MGLNDFTASPCFISAKLKCNNKVRINIHGEKNDVTYEESYIIISAWRKVFHDKIVEVDTPPVCVYNADQNGLYHHNLPNRVYVDESKRRIMLV